MSKTKYTNVPATVVNSTFQYVIGLNAASEPVSCRAERKATTKDSNGVVIASNQAPTITLTPAEFPPQLQTAITKLEELVDAKDL